LPGRQNIVVTRDANYRREGITVVHGIDDAVRAAGAASELMVIGGAELFRLFLPRATRVHLTRVHADVAGDVVWSALDASWSLVESEAHAADERHASSMTFEVWEKRT
jgi:dihydrofolate reductase